MKNKQFLKTNNFCQHSNLQKKRFTEFNHVIIDESIKKETNLLIKYYKGLEIDPQKLEKLNKSAQKILNEK